MFHPYRKDSSYLRTALFSVYKEKCVYCGRKIQQRDMHVDHVLPSNIGICNDDEVKQYLIELENSGFISDSIENYLPSCPACNISKNNHVYSAATLRFLHAKAKAHAEEILQRISKQKDGTGEFFLLANRHICLGRVGFLISAQHFTCHHGLSFNASRC